MKRITVLLPEKMIEELDRLVEEGFFPNRIEAIRESIRELLVSHNCWRTEIQGKTYTSSSLIKRIDSFKEDLNWRRYGRYGKPKR